MLKGIDVGVDQGWDGWMDGVRMALGERSMPVEQGRLNALDRRRWELIVKSE